MKKLLLSCAVLFSAISLNAQQDTLSSHLAGAISLYLVDGEEPLDSGYITGTNAYNDKAKLQKFDAADGLSGAGTISGVALCVPAKAGTGSYQVVIWPDNAGVPAFATTPLAVGNTTLAATDTATAAFGLINGTSLYNHVVMFPAPIAIPANNIFWAAVILPTTGELALLSNNVQTAPYAASASKTGEIWEDNTFHSLSAAWGAPLTTAIYPIVNIGATNGLSENVISAAVFPNPAKDVLNVTATEEIANVTIVTMDGKVVASSSTGEVNVADLNSGMYIYNVTTINGRTANGTFAKN